MTTITPTEHEKSEWSRFAKWAYANNRNDIGHRFSMAATVRKHEAVNVAWYDEIQKVYRNWLVFNDVPARVAV